MRDTETPSHDTPLDQLKQSIRSRLKTLNSSKAKYRSYYNTFTLTLVILAATNTAFVAFSQEAGSMRFWGYLAIILSALISVLSGADGLIKPRDKHGQNADALNQVYDVQARLLFRELEQPPMTEVEVRAFFLEFRALEKSFFASLVRINLQDK
jgi:hypothetical protein